MIFDDNLVIICLFLHKNLCCGCSLESPRRGDSNEHLQHRFLTFYEGEAILMSTHNIGFYEDLTKIIFELSSNIIKYAPYFVCCIKHYGVELYNVYIHDMMALGLPVARFTERLITYLSPKTYLTTHLRPKTCLILKICIKTCHKSIL